MTRQERDAALAMAAERYCGLLRLQRTRRVTERDLAGAVRLEPELNAAVDRLLVLTDALIEPDPSKE